jgi:hypothetical protein
MKAKHVFSWLIASLLIITLFGTVPAAAAPEDAPSQGFKAPKPKFIESVAFDISPALRNLPRGNPNRLPEDSAAEPLDIRPERGGPRAADNGFTGDGAVNASSSAPSLTNASLTLSAPIANFEGISNQDNFNLLGGRVNPPDPVGDVGPNHYVEMVNLAYAVYDKQGNLLLGPLTLGSLWQNFSVTDCANNAGDPVVVYDQFADRWLLSQFTSAGPKYWNCIAISQTADPTGAYYRYAFITQPDPDLEGGTFFPDYPKYGVWKDSYILTTRDFGDVSAYGISVYALEKNKMVNGETKARAVQFFIDGNVPANLPLVGDGLLPPDVDGRTKPKTDAPAPIVGTQDDDYVYGAAFDALNIFELNVLWNSRPSASFQMVAQLPVAEFDSNFPCGPSRGCIPQPGITNPDQYLDILSYRQRPTYRLAYRNFGTYETMVTNQSVEALPGVAGVRWYEIRRANGQYALYQQGTYAPNDGVHRWMGSVAMDKFGNIAAGYSVSNATDVYPGIRYTGRLAGDPLGQMTLGEGVIINGTGVQTTTNSRWGDYTSMNVDPVDDCTFWYVNEYYQVSGLPLPLPPPPLPPPGTTAPWQTRIASFRLPGCN